MTSGEVSAEEELVAFETGAVDPAKLPHAEHVRLGYEMLGRNSFGEAVVRFSRGLRHLVAKAGKPGLYHETITVAFLALIAERRAVGDHMSWQEFVAKNRELLDKRCLEKWYDRTQLESSLARTTFCLPAPRPTLGKAHGRLTAAQAIKGYASVFSAYIAWSSFTTASHAYGNSTAVFTLATAEVGAAILFILRATRTIGLVLLLLIFAVAATAEMLLGGSAARFVLYAASALLVWRLSAEHRLSSTTG
jgi:hypothetical protein